MSPDSHMKSCFSWVTVSSRGRCHLFFEFFQSPIEGQFSCIADLLSFRLKWPAAHQIDNSNVFKVTFYKKLSKHSHHPHLDTLYYWETNVWVNISDYNFKDSVNCLHHNMQGFKRKPQRKEGWVFKFLLHVLLPTVCKNITER